jgi:pimeloyl-ACP methyl ester carboxylesterase
MNASHIHESYVISSSEKLYVKSVGNPEADNVLILIHGGPGLSHTIMKDLEQLASDQLLVGSYDQRGCSRSMSITREGGQVKELPGKIPECLDLLSYVQDLEAVRRAVAAGKKVHLLGHSWGGLLAMHYTIHYPEQVCSLLLIDSTPPTWNGAMAGDERFVARVQALQQQGIIPMELSTDEKEGLAQVMPAYAPGLDFSLLEAEVTPGINEKTLEAIKGFDLREQLAPLALPVLIFFGAEDPFGTEWAEETKAALRNAQVTMKIVPNCGHLGLLEYPDIFYSTVQDFLVKQR